MSKESDKIDPEEGEDKKSDEYEYDPDENWVFLDPHDSHLDARVDRDGVSIECLHDDGFQYLWKGIRTNYGVKNEGVFMFEVKIMEYPQVKMPETKAINQNICRIGFSQPLTSLFLGDTSESWGWGGTGKKSHNNTYTDYGGTYEVGDVIGAIIDIEQGTISYTKNGAFVGVAFDNLPPSIIQTGLFPHLLMKNVKVKCNFSRKTKFYDPPGPQVKFFEEAPEDDAIANPVAHPQNLKECEFLLMAGLPGCGKTYWAQKHMDANPQSNFLLLGTNSVIDQMKVMNVNRTRNYADRWQELISQATPVFNKLVEIAGKTPRNVILDQTNVYGTARKRKAAAFKDFGTRVCVTIATDEDTLKSRTEKREREEGKFVPEEAVQEMRANFACPELEDGFTEMQWPELPERDAREQIQKIQSGGKDWKARNPWSGGGNKAFQKLENRTADQIGKGRGKAGWNEKTKSWDPKRSRSPHGRGDGGGGGGGGAGGAGGGAGGAAPGGAAPGWSAGSSRSW